MTRHTREDVLAAVAALFPHEDPTVVMEILDLYSTEGHEGGRERVQLACLKLSAGKLDDLLHYIDVANQDYRDVLYWAEYS